MNRNLNSLKIFASGQRITTEEGGHVLFQGGFSFPEVPFFEHHLTEHGI